MTRSRCFLTAAVSYDNTYIYLSARKCRYGTLSNNRSSTCLLDNGFMSAFVLHHISKHVLVSSDSHDCRLCLGNFNLCKSHTSNAFNCTVTTTGVIRAPQVVYFSQVNYLHVINTLSFHYQRLQFGFFLYQCGLKPYSPAYKVASCPNRLLKTTSVQLVHY